MLDLSARNQLLHLNLSTSRPSATNLMVADERRTNWCNDCRVLLGCPFFLEKSNGDPDSRGPIGHGFRQRARISRHEDAKIQTLLEDMAALHRNLQKMAKRSDDLYNEKGVKTLSLVFGFLEYPQHKIPRIRTLRHCSCSRWTW